MGISMIMFDLLFTNADSYVPKSDI